MGICAARGRHPRGRHPGRNRGGRGADDTVETAARRELEEETGYRAAVIEELGEFYSSPGMVSESFSLVRATGLSRVGEGGGTDGEEIIVHCVPRHAIGHFVAAARERGIGIDVKLLMLLRP